MQVLVKMRVHAPDAGNAGCLHQGADIRLRTVHGADVRQATCNLSWQVQPHTHRQALAFWGLGSQRQWSLDLLTDNCTHYLSAG
jgi:hypothetical protein